MDWASASFRGRNTSGKWRAPEKTQEWLLVRANHLQGEGLERRRNLEVEMDP